MDPRADITQLLARANAGDDSALDRLLPLVYDELRALARRHLGRRGATLDTTAVVHEAYLKVFGKGPAELVDRSHFYGTVCLAMRQVVRDHARRRNAHKRGGDALVVTLDSVEVGVERDLLGLIALDEALDDLQALDPRLCEVVNLRFFAGLTVEEIAQLRGQTERTVHRDWRKARALLLSSLDAHGDGDGA